MGEMAESQPATVAAQAPQAPTPVTELYILVVAGNHDPRQHQPYWYRLINVLSEDELRDALSNGFSTRF